MNVQQKACRAKLNLSDLIEVSLKSIKFRPPYFKSLITAGRATLSGSLPQNVVTDIVDLFNKRLWSRQNWRNIYHFWK